MRVLSTGVEIIDHLLGGITQGLPCVVAGPSGSGRTVLALQLAAAALDSGRVISFLCNEPAPFLLQQASTLGFDFDSSLRSGQLALLEMGSTISGTVNALGADALTDSIADEQPLSSLLIVDPFTVITAGIFDEAQLRATARAFVKGSSSWTTVLTVESERLALQQGLERILGEVCGSFLSLRREVTGQRLLRVEKSRSGVTEHEETEFSIEVGGTERIVSTPAAIETRPQPATPEPTSPAEPECETTAAAATKKPDAEPENTRPVILLVDNDRASRDLMSKWLDARYEVMTAGDGFEALTCLIGQRPDLVVLDLMMPRVTGYELLAAFQRTLQTIPRLVISSQVERSGARLAPLVLGATDILAKPVTRLEFLHKIETLLRLSSPPEMLMEPLEAESLFASISKTRLLTRDEFHDRLERACGLGERLALPSSLAAIAADSSQRLDHFLDIVDQTLRFEDAVLRVSKRRAVLLLVATECADATSVLDRLFVRFEDDGGQPDHLELRISNARRLDDSYDWHQLFRDHRSSRSRRSR